MSLSRDQVIDHLHRELNIEDPIDGETELFSSGLLDSCLLYTSDACRRAI